MAEIRKGKKQDHHIVAKSYLNQWKGEDGQLQLFTHDDGKYLKRGSNWVGFKKQNYNIYEEDANFFIPERITEDIDGQGINVIRSLVFGQELTVYQRSVISQFVALQYVRTPRFRKETDLMLEEQIKEPFLEHQRKLTDEELLQMKKDVLTEKSGDERDRKAIQEINAMSDEEFIDMYKDFISSSDNMRVGLNNFGHSKHIFKVSKKAKGLFSFMWFLLEAAESSYFITSDNPCFAVPKEGYNFGVGLFSKNGLVIFPLRPDLCLIISPAAESGDERFKKLSKTQTKEINQFILKNSHEVVAARQIQHLKSLLKGYKHNKLREVKTKEFGDYKLISLI